MTQGGSKGGGGRGRGGRSFTFPSLRVRISLSLCIVCFSVVLLYSFLSINSNVLSMEFFITSIVPVPSFVM